jgi:PPP family 3-phenylpropionic acid transporter
MLPALARVPGEQRGHAHEVRSPWGLLTPALRAFLATAFLLNASCGAWQGFFALHVAALGLPDSLPGLAWGLAVMLEIVLFVWGRRLVERFDAADLVLVAVGLTVLRWLGTAAARSAPLVVGLQLGHVVTFSVFHLAAMLLLARLVPAASSTTGMGLYGFVAFGVGLGVGIALAGALIDVIGTSRLFVVEAVLAALALVPAVRLVRLTRAVRT